ncbi:Cytochrome c peroxidase [Flavobacterium beibuense]|uniref:Cytochrome c peroxidase n=1 Tax=Flavobacterium beibuense TaxID=657326 RepID=A0A444W3X0_9FLAO|nr:Cytochrome c peroxidase [Flavobacterium beibuense]
MYKGYNRFVLLFFLIVFILPFNLQYTSVSDYYDDDFRTVIITGIDDLNSQLNKLEQQALNYKKGNLSLEQLKEQLAKTRYSFKQSEYILEYYYPKHIKAYINGAPLDHPDPLPIDKNASGDYYNLNPEQYKNSMPIDNLEAGHYKGEVKIVAPVGLQVLDETLYTDDNPDKDEVYRLAKGVRDSYQVLVTAFKSRTFFYDFEVMEACRLELVRITARGITGFDTPGSLNAMEEAASSMAGIEKVLEPLLSKAETNLNKSIKGLFKKSISVLNKSRDFDGFDRLNFITEYINPLYKHLLDLQLSLHIKSSAEVHAATPSWNAYSTNMFSEDFLNPYYYSLLKEEKDSDALRDLGRKLFYDTALSRNGMMSCASCHKPEVAFSDGHKKSFASIEGKNVLRNSPSLINSVYADRYFYDMRAYDLEEQAEHVVENHMEFNTSFEVLVQKLNSDKVYREQFNAVFKTNTPVTRYHFSSALSSYVLSLRSFSSPFDLYMQGKSKELPKDVKAGFNLFMGKAGCATCHYMPTFSGLVPPLYDENESEVLGVLRHPDTLMVDTDYGRIANGVIDERHEIYRNSFKTVSVRNVKLTGPYFHNGAYETLEQVIDFYNEGGAAGKGLSYELPNQTLPPDKLELSKKEIKELIAFLESLTDNPSSIKK